MRQRAAKLILACLATCVIGAAPAQAAFDVRDFDVTFTDDSGAIATQAGSHSFALTVAFGLSFDEVGGEPVADGRIKDFIQKQVPGLVGDTGYEECSNLAFLQSGDCPVETQVGVTAVALKPGWAPSPVFNLSPPSGKLLRLGWNVAGEANIVVDVSLNPEAPHNGIAAARNTPQVLDVFGAKVQIWGDPSSPAHDDLRGDCLPEKDPNATPFDDVEGFEFEGTGASCSLAAREPFLTLPTNCSEPLASSFEAFSWEGEFDSGSVLTHDVAGNPQAFAGCGNLDFKPSIDARPTSRAAESPTGLDFALEVDDQGLTSAGGLAQSHIRKTVVTLPPGMTANPSIAEGLGVCGEDDLARETLSSGAGQGCPEASKIGTIEVESPLVNEAVGGALYQAEPFTNLAGDSVIAFYIVLKNPGLGIIVKQPVKVEPDPRTGQLIATTDDIPQLPVSSFKLKFREGGRSPLITPPTCGTFETKAVLTPWSGTPPVTSTSAFQVISGPNGAPCPAGRQPFEPGFEAGSQNNAAGDFSPFSMRLTRRDGDQDLTRFDATLPAGALAKLAGVSRCTDAQSARADNKTGREELANPSCPANSRIGSVISGAGVGSQLTYVRGSVYLGGRFAGAPLSAVAIVPAVAGPFDIGTVVVRQALVVDPVTGEVTADGARSQPIPHILAGIPLRVRDIQVNIDRPKFTINPTSCERMATDASIWGGGVDPFSIADNAPVSRSARYQAADCASLGFQPRFGLQLQGGTRRGANPSLRVVLRPRSGDANIERAVVRLPRSAFLDQAHIRTVCTRVQFAANACPKGAIYGHVTAFTPLLDEPLRGPAYLRSSNNKLPDLVFALKGIVDVEVAARIDSIRGGIRSIVPTIPDAPLTKVVLRMQGGKKGLLVNSRNLCGGKSRASVVLDGHNGARRALRPVVRPVACSKRGKAGRG